MMSRARSKAALRACWSAFGTEASEGAVLSAVINMAGSTARKTADAMCRPSRGACALLTMAIRQSAAFRAKPSSSGCTSNAASSLTARVAASGEPPRGRTCSRRRSEERSRVASAGRAAMEQAPSSPELVELWPCARSWRKPRSALRKAAGWNAAPHARSAPRTASSSRYAVLAPKRSGLALPIVWARTSTRARKRGSGDTTPGSAGSASQSQSASQASSGRDPRASARASSVSAEM
mmetsp:Transcript_83072/g.235347  ORF Transcript_83072/g.235347 Transcript_83072/m.235347 type:complete len:237 (-) Transcript_83072:257-967(-)